jgi:predicted RNase H-like HicB family nuclease
MMVASRVLHHEFTAVVEPPNDDDRWWIAYCPEVPGANGQGDSEDEAIQSLREAIVLVLQTRLEEGLRGVPREAKQTTVTVG